MSLPTRKTISIFLALLLAACGGGSDSTPVAPAGDTTTGSGDTTGTPPSSPQASSPSAGDSGSATGDTAFQLDATARFNLPSDIVADNAGNLFVMDRGNQAIRKIAANGDVSTLAGSYAARTTLAISPSGQLFVLTGTDIYKVAADGGKTLVKSYPQSPGSYAPLGIAIDGQERIYVLLEYRNIFRINRINTDNSETGVYYVNSYGSVTNIASDAAGNLAVGVSAAGGPAVSADGSGINVSHVDFVPLSAQSDANTPAPGVVHRPVDDIYVSGTMAFDATGNIFMTGAKYGTATTAGSLLVTEMKVGKLAADGTVTTVLNGFPGGDNTPRQIATDIAVKPGLTVDKKNNLYLADPFDQAIYSLPASGLPTLIAGKPGDAGNAD